MEEKGWWSENKLLRIWGLKATLAARLMLSGLRPLLKDSDADGSKNVEARQGCGDENAGALWMPVKFLHIVLSLMNKQQLGWDRSQSWVLSLPFSISFHSQVPLSHLVVGTRGCKDATVCRMPLDRRDGGCVLLEGGDG